MYKIFREKRKIISLNNSPKLYDFYFKTIGQKPNEDLNDLRKSLALNVLFKKISTCEKHSPSSDETKNYLNSNL